MTKYDNIPGFNGYYISKRGGLWSRYLMGSKHRKLLTNYRKLKPLKRKNGRYRCYVVHNTKGKIKMSISRLVALAYIPNPENKPCVCHKDNNPSNDYYKNLYWGTYKENSQQMVRDGRLNTPFGNKSKNINYGKRGWNDPKSRVDERMFRKILKLRDRGYTNKVIIDRLNLPLKSPTLSRMYKRYKLGYYDNILYTSNEIKDVETNTTNGENKF